MQRLLLASVLGIAALAHSCSMGQRWFAAPTPEGETEPISRPAVDRSNGALAPEVGPGEPSSPKPAGRLVSDLPDPEVDSDRFDDDSSVESEAALLEPLVVPTSEDLDELEMDPELPMPAVARFGGPPSIDPDRSLIATARYTAVYKKPDPTSSKIGYLRAGAVVARHPEPAERRKCPGGFFRIEPEGYVCAGVEATIDPEHLIAQSLRYRPDRTAPLPYRYGLSRHPAPPFYTRIPTPEEQRRIEQELHYHRRHHDASAWRLLGLKPIPGFLTDGQPSLRPNGTRQSALIVQDGQAIPKSGFALLDLFESEGRAFGLTTDLAVMPLDRLDVAPASRFHGLPLTDEVTLPVVFVRSRSAYLYEGEPEKSGFHSVRPLEFREALPITGRQVRVGPRVYLQTQSGHYLLDDKLVRVDPLEMRPSWAYPGRTWIDVSILKQTLVAFEGDKPMFVTLVSTGIDGLKNPLESHATITGRYLIHTKHVSVTMSGDEVGDEFDLRDVPYVQYFHEGYALHGVYWHDAFGTPRSHGCVNLSPADARWLFGFTDPPVPGRWHGAMSLNEGTLVSIHP